MFLFIILIFALFLSYYTLRYLWEWIPMNFDRSLNAVFISGCDSGFGRLLALKCCRAGFPVYAGCLTEQGAESLAEEAKPLQLITVLLDVTKDESIEAAQKFVAEDIAKTPGKRLWALVNNAGVFSIHGPDAWCTIAEYQRSIDVNALGVIRCTHAFVPQIKASKGRIVSVTSVAGRVAIPFSAPYCVAKFGCEAYMDVLRMELAIFGVKCCILEPGIFRTPLLNETQMSERVEEVWKPLSEEVKAEYGSDYKDKFVKMWNNFMRNNSSTRLELVVDSYFHAISARFPRLRYRCGADAIFFYIPLSFMPTKIVDLMLSSKKDGLMPADVIKQKSA